MASPPNPNDPTGQQSDASSSGSGGQPSGRPPVDPTGSAAPPTPPPGYEPTSSHASQNGRSSPVATIFKLATSGTLIVLLIGSLAANIYLGYLVSEMMAGPREATYQPGAGTTDQRIVIVPIDGLIGEGTHSFLRSALDELRNDPPAAIILRVDSPGGGVGASDRMLHAIKRFRAEMKQGGHDIPIVASFGSYAASGGYYVSMASDQIIAEPTCMTGSIGVIAQAFTVNELMNKVGVTPEIVTSTDSTKKDMLNTFESWDEQDRQKLRGILDTHYQQFVAVVAEGRDGKLSREQVQALATGEAFMAEEAEEKNLVDSVGYLTDAIDAAAQAAQITGEPRVTQMQRPVSFGLGSLVGGESPRWSQMDAQAARHWLLEAASPRVMYLWVPGQ